MGAITRHGRVAGFWLVTTCVVVLTAGLFAPRAQGGAAVAPAPPAAVDTAPVERAMQAIRAAWLDELDQLVASARQFAVADDTYEFMVRPNIPYVEHYALDRLTDARIDTVLIIDSKGTPLFWRRVNPGHGRGFADAKAFFLELPAFSPVRAPGVPGLAGVVRLIQGASLVVAMPIFPSSRSASSRGWLILARALDDRQWARYLDAVPFAVGVLDPSVLAMPKGIEAALRAPLASIIRVDRTYVRGLMAVPGPNGRAFRVISVRMPRAARGPAGPGPADAALQGSFWPSFAAVLVGAVAVVLTVLLLWPHAAGRRPVRTVAAVPLAPAQPRTRVEVGLAALHSVHRFQTRSASRTDRANRSAIASS